MGQFKWNLLLSLNKTSFGVTIRSRSAPGPFMKKNSLAEVLHVTIFILIMWLHII